MIVIRCMSLANGEPGPTGQFLKSYSEHTGFADWTHEVSDAMRFTSTAEAWALWRSVLPSQPVRPWDGQPNRPLTAFSVEIGEY